MSDVIGDDLLSDFHPILVLLSNAIISASSGLTCDSALSCCTKISRISSSLDFVHVLRIAGRKYTCDQILFDYFLSD